LILNHGRLSKKKGLDVLIAAMFQVLSSHDARLAFVGSDDEGHGEELRTLATSLGILDHIKFIPQLSGRDLGDAILSATIWCLPSHGENFGMAVVEALSAGRPVVTSPHVNIAPDAATANALLIAQNTPEATAEAILRLLGDPQRRLELGKEGKEYAKRYEWSTIAPRFRKLYEGIIAERS